MRKSRYTEEQIIGFIKQPSPVCRSRICAARVGFSHATFYKWRAEYGGMDVPDAKRLRELEAEKLEEVGAAVDRKRYPTSTMQKHERFACGFSQC